MRWDRGLKRLQSLPLPTKNCFFISHSGQGLCNSAKRVMRLGVSAFFGCITPKRLSEATGEH